MGTMGVNLRQLYQRPVAWFWYLFALSQSFTFMMILTDGNGAGNGAIMSYLIAVVVFAFVAGSLQVDILSKPFSYTLPGHKLIPRKFIVSVGVCVSLFVSLVFIFYPGLSMREALLSFVAAACFAFAIYILIASGSLIIRNEGSSGWLSLVVFVGAFYLGGPVFFESAIVKHPFAVIIPSVCVSVLLIVRVGNVDLGRRFCGQMYLGVLNSFNIAKAKRYREYRLAEKMEAKGLQDHVVGEAFFTEHMRSSHSSSVARSVWGSLYASFALFRLNTLRGFVSPFLMCVFAALFYGYFASVSSSAPFKMVNLIFFAPLIAASLLPLPICYSGYVPAGRKERFWASLVYAAAITAVVTCVMSLLAYSSLIIAPYMPSITYKGMDLSFCHMDPGLFYLSIIVMPIGFSLQLLIRDSWPKASIGIFVFSMVLALSVPFGFMFDGLMLGVRTSFLAVGFVLASWLFFIAVTWYHSAKRCLVGKAGGVIWPFFALLIILMAAYPVASYLFGVPVPKAPVDTALIVEAQHRAEISSPEIVGRPATIGPPKEYVHPISITGRARDEQGDVIIGAEIYLAAGHPGGRRLAKTRTDKNGEYRFTDVPLPIVGSDASHSGDSGAFQVFGIASGYALAWQPQKFMRAQIEHSSRRRLSSGVYGTGDAIELDLGFEKGSGFRGRIVDDEGNPIPNVRVSIRDGDSRWDRKNYKRSGGIDSLDALNEKAIVPPRIKTRVTDKEGFFEFSDLPSDHRWWLDVRPSGHPSRMVWVVTNDKGANESTSKDGVTIYRQDFELIFVRPREILFRVIYSDTGEPAEKVGVSYGLLATTDAQGYATGRLPDGKHKLWISPRFRTPYLSTTAEIEVTAESVDQPFVIPLQPAAIVNITVLDSDTGKPLEGVDVLEDGSILGWYSWEVETRTSRYVEPRTDETGKMQVLLDPGRHNISVRMKSSTSGDWQTAPVQHIDCKRGEPAEVLFKLKKTMMAAK